MTTVRQIVAPKVPHCSQPGDERAPSRHSAADGPFARPFCALPEQQLPCSRGSSSGCLWVLQAWVNAAARSATRVPTARAWPLRRPYHAGAGMCCCVSSTTTPRLLAPRTIGQRVASPTAPHHFGPRTVGRRVASLTAPHLLGPRTAGWRVASPPLRTFLTAPSFLSPRTTGRRGASPTAPHHFGPRTVGRRVAPLAAPHLLGPRAPGRRVASPPLPTAIVFWTCCTVVCC